MFKPKRLIALLVLLLCTLAINGVSAQLIPTQESLGNIYIAEYSINHGSIEMWVANGGPDIQVEDWMVVLLDSYGQEMGRGFINGLLPSQSSMPASVWWNGQPFDRVVLLDSVSGYQWWVVSHVPQGVAWNGKTRVARTMNTQTGASGWTAQPQ